VIEKDIFVHINQFDGPLGLLLYLVKREEMDIQDLDLTKITGQYLDYISKMEELNFDVAGEFLYMSSVLIFLKSQKSVDDEQKTQISQIDNELEIHSKEQLILKLKELEHYQKISTALWALPKVGSEFYARPKIDKKLHFQTLFKEMSVNELTSVMIDYLKKSRRQFHVITKDKLSIKGKLESLKSILLKGKKFLFEDLLDITKNRTEEMVMTFISLLELARLKRLEVFQAENSKEIHVNVIKDLQNFNVDQADGFEDEEPEQILGQLQ
jgi:segregation and condensation protein A